MSPGQRRVVVEGAGVGDHIRGPGQPGRGGQRVDLAGRRARWRRRGWSPPHGCRVGLDLRGQPDQVLGWCSRARRWSTVQVSWAESGQVPVAVGDTAAARRSGVGGAGVVAGVGLGLPPRGAAGVSDGLPGPLLDLPDHVGGQRGQPGPGPRCRGRGHPVGVDAASDRPGRPCSCRRWSPAASPASWLAVGVLAALGVGAGSPPVRCQLSSDMPW